MPLYEYYCECGKEFEELCSMPERNNVVCPICQLPAHIKISVPRKPLVAHTFTTFGHDGRIIGQRQTTERTPIVGSSREHEVTKK